MKGKAVFPALIVIEACCLVWSVLGMWGLYPTVAFAIILAATSVIYYIVLRPISTIEEGMNLLRAQDYASRLRHVGQSDADNIVGLFNDLMDNLKNERLATEEKNLFLEQLIEASQQGIVIMDYDGKNIISSNPTAKEILKDIDLPDIEDGQSLTVRSNHGNAYKVTRQSFIDKGFHRSFFIIDSMTEELRTAQRDAYGKIIRIIAHEVNNTMGGLDSVMQTVSEVSDGDIADAVECCREMSQNLTEFISAYTDLVKLPTPQLSAMQLADSIEPMKAMINTYAEVRGVQVEYALTKSGIVHLDPILWQQAIINIVKNSVESILSTGRADGKITISTISESSLCISDNGAGISSEQSQHLFTPFYTTKPSGQGIGLSLVSEILQRHGCKYSLLSAEGITSFNITFDTL